MSEKMIKIIQFRYTFIELRKFLQIMSVIDHQKFTSMSILLQKADTMYRQNGFEKTPDLDAMYGILWTYYFNELSEIDILSMGTDEKFRFVSIHMEKFCRAYRCGVRL